MRIVCPSCAAAYEVPAPILAKRRRMRCARCHDDWAIDPALIAAAVASLPAPVVVEPAAPKPVPLESPDLPTGLPPDLPAAPAFASIAEPEPDADAPELEDAAPQSRLPENAIPVLAAWLVSLAILASLAWGLIEQRVAIMQAWPPSARLYSALGYVS
jgi:predicted Zn finger-like uncharacterized protein